MTYSVTMTGKIKADAEKIAPHFAKLFKTDPAKAQQLLQSGKPRTLAKGLDEDKARKLLARLGKIGVVAKVEPAFPAPKQEPDLAATVVIDPAATPVFESASSDDAMPSFAAAKEEPAPAAKPEPALSLNDAQAAATPKPAAASRVEQHHDDEDDDWDEPDVHSVPAMNGFAWLSGSFEMLKAQPVGWIVALVGLVLINAIMAAIPVVGEYLSMLLWPVLFAGIMVGAHEQVETGEFSGLAFLSGFSHNPVALIILGVLTAVAVVASSLLVVLVLGLLGLESPWTTGAVIMVLLLPVIFINLFAPCLVAINGMSAIDAIKWSLTGGIPNALPVIVHLISMMLVMIVGALAFGVGLLVAFPIICGSIYLAYADIFD